MSNFRKYQIESYGLTWWAPGIHFNFDLILRPFIVIKIFIDKLVTNSFQSTIFYITYGEQYRVFIMLNHNFQYKLFWNLASITKLRVSLFIIADVQSG